jgi:peptidoglycan/LPS O-acetylase OafA/YrhL
MASPEAAPRQRWVAGLTPLRGIAALFVVLFHAPIFGIGFTLYSRTYFFYQGWLWVDFFFLLSGFIMAHVYGAWFADGVRAAAVRAFLVRRFARLWPLHVATLAALVGLEAAKFLGPFAFSQTIPPPFTGHSVPATIPLHLAFLQFLTADVFGTWNTPSWSIGCEWWAYAAFPALFLGLTRLGGVARALFFAACYLALIAVWASGGGSLNLGQNEYALARCLAEFALGIGIFELWRRGAARRLLGGDAAFAALAFAIALALHLAVWGFLVVPLMGTLILAAAANRGRVGAALEHRAMRWLGEISYSIYLVHWPVFIAVALIVGAAQGTRLAQTPSKLEALALLGAALPAILGLATLSYRYVEVPARRWLTRRLGASGPVAAPAGLATAAD